MDLAVNNDETVQKSGLVFSEVLSRHLRYSQPQLVTIYPEDPKDNSKGSRGFSFLYPEDYHIAKGVVGIQDIGFQKSYISGTPGALDAAFKEKFSKWRTCIFYYYDKTGVINPKSKNCIYEFAVRLKQGKASDLDASDYFLSKQSKLDFNPSDPDAPNGFNLTSFVQDHKNSMKKVATNVVFFKVSQEEYPLVTVEVSFSYGKGGSSSNVKKEAAINDFTEVFDLGFQVYPGI